MSHSHVTLFGVGECLSLTEQAREVCIYVGQRVRSCLVVVFRVLYS